MIDLEFIKRAMELLKDEAEKSYRENRAHHNECQIKYFNTEKGFFAKTKGDYKRRALKKEAVKEISWEEKKLIGKFYKNCPEGYEVDHIIPISKGGLHCLCNLQYLTIEDNRRKGAKLEWRLNDQQQTN